MSFIFGGNTNQTYEQLQTQRRLAEAMMQRQGTPQNVGQGLEAASGRILGALMNKRADERENELRGKFNSDFQAALGGPTSGSFVAPGGEGSAAAKGQQATQSGMNPMDFAATMMGKGEVPDNATLQEFMKNGGQNLDPATTAWCAAFVNASLSHAGMEGTGKLNARSFLNWGQEVTDPQRGDVAVFTRGDPNGWQGHVGFFDGYDDDGNIRVLGGNQSDGVNVSSYAKDRLLGFRRAGPSGPSEQPDMARLAQLASNPLASEGQRAVLSAMMTQQMQANDPMRQLDMEYKRAQIAKMNAPDPGAELDLQIKQERLNQLQNPQPKERDIKKAADGRYRYTDGDKELVYPDLEIPAEQEMTESERRIFMFNSIQQTTGPAINRIEDEGFDPANVKDRFANGVLGGNWVKSQEGQMYDAAAGAWSESALRLATGAAATPEEYARIKNMYFAQVGDSLETIQFKRAMRAGYESVLTQTLAGKKDENAPDPLAFAINQFYDNRDKVSTDALPEPQGVEPPSDAPSTDFTSATLDDLLGADINTMTAEQMDAWEKRMNELQGGK